jgi:hypothetical protein
MPCWRAVLCDAIVLLATSVLVLATAHCIQQVSLSSVTDADVSDCVAGELYLEFTQVDPQQPDRPFGFALQVVGDDDHYTGKQCSAAASCIGIVACLLARRRQLACVPGTVAFPQPLSKVSLQLHCC